MSNNANNLEKVKRVVAILEKEYKYHYTHEQLALKVGTDESCLRIAFKQVYETTIDEYLHEIRVAKAKELLEMTHLPVHTIAATTGFTDASAFIKDFKKSTGSTPLKWRKSGAKTESTIIKF